MKKVFLLIGTISVSLSSCGGDEEKGKDKHAVTVCDCVNGIQYIKEDLIAAEGDDVKTIQLNDELLELSKKCNKLAEGLSDEELTQLKEEASKCEEH